MQEAERLKRFQRDNKFITSTCSADWSRDVIATLFEDNDEEDYVTMEAAQTEVHSHKLRGDFSVLDTTRVADAFSKSRGHRCVLLDLGGTLVDRESTSIYTKYDFHGTSRRLPSASVLESIGKLASDPQTTVVVISGQTKSAMARTLGRLAPLGLVAETGMFYSWGVSSVAKSDDEKKADSSVTSKVCSGVSNDIRHIMGTSISYCRFSSILTLTIYRTLSVTISLSLYLYTERISNHRARVTSVFVCFAFFVAGVSLAPNKFSFVDL